jgi:hypothetical protein
VSFSHCARHYTQSDSAVANAPGEIPVTLALGLVAQGLPATESHDPYSHGVVATVCGLGVILILLAVLVGAVYVARRA